MATSSFVYVFLLSAEYEHEIFELGAAGLCWTRETAAMVASVIDCPCQSYSNAMCSPDESEKDSACHRCWAENYPTTDLGLTWTIVERSLTFYATKLDLIFHPLPFRCHEA